MALVAPLMLLILTGIASFSMALYQKLLITEAVSSAGRVLAAEQGQTDPCSDAWAALTRSAPGLSASNITMTITWIAEPSGTTRSYSNNTCTAMGTGVKSGDYGQISATYPCILQVVNIWGHGPGFQGCTVGAAVAEDIQ
jgi:Flp pilus assembly protein TadG